jgi:DNA-directed RNA polymerase II subunit RPB11
MEVREKLIASQLLLDPSVLFAGYKVPHPLENDIVIKIQTDDRSNPADALKRACAALIAQTVSIKQQFSDQAKNVENGLGPDQGMGMGAPMAMGGYDPYGDGLGRTAAAAPTADAYDF